MLITRNTIAAKMLEAYRLAQLTPRWPLNREELHAKVLDELFTPFAWPGGYTVVFYDSDGEPLCRDCAINYVYGFDVNDPDESREGIEKKREVVRDTYWEGPPQACADCGKLLESAYGIPESDGN